MKVLLTGNKGFLGSELECYLNNKNIQTIGFDIKDNLDVCDYSQLIAKSSECNIIIHLASIDNNIACEIYKTNIIGTMNVLNVFRDSHIEKLIFLSSVDALGIFQGEDKPKYLPIDDAYPCHPQKPYSISKLLNENMCSYYASLCNKPILCFRAPGIWSGKTYEFISNNRINDPSYEWNPFWEYGAFIDIRDLVHAIYLSLNAQFTGFHCHNISSNDITTSGKTSRELVNFIHPNVTWKGDKSYQVNKYKTLLENENIKRLLGWEPDYSWKRYINEKGNG
jgi:UDP-glucose 4-epimerase